MISDFRGAYRGLSNFHVAPVLFEGDMYPSSEHAYQAAKSLHDEVRRAFREPSVPTGGKHPDGRPVLRLMTSGEAKRQGRNNRCREDWEQVKLSVMTLILIDKFSRHPDLTRLLLETGDQKLAEGNYWHDNYWGSCTCAKCGNRGKNYLGRTLMLIRDALNEDNRRIP